MSEPRYPPHGSDHLDLILATSEIGIWELDAMTGKALRNLRHDQIFGHDTFLPDWSAEIFFTYVHAPDRERVKQLMLDAIANGAIWSFETRIRRADGEDRWINAKGTPKFDAAGQVARLVGHVIDVTDTKANEDRLRLLARELNHRVGNSFAIMSSIVRQASRKTKTVDEFAKTLLARIEALARANRVLVAAEAERSTFREILAMELAAFGGWQDRVRVAGQGNVRFSPEASEALTLIIHELLTNAVKHGALSVPGGTVEVQVSGRDNDQTRIDWIERGGPPVAPTRRPGIGSAVLQSALRSQGSAEMDFRPEGLICTLTLTHRLEQESPLAP